MVCGSELAYLEHAEDLACSVCGAVESGHIRCPRGHYVCNTCHNRDSRAAIEDITLHSALKDPLEIAELMMSNPSLPMLGCQHAYIAAGALLAALRNEGTRKITEAEVKEVFSRTERQAIGGYCGLTGVCGITPAIGAVFALLLSSKCGTDTEQRITMEATMRISKAIMDLTGPSCCKAYVRASLEVAVDMLKDRLGISLPLGKGKQVDCSYVTNHPHGCRTTECPYFGSDHVQAAQQSSSNPAREADC